MRLKELPDDRIGIYIAAGLTDQFLGQVLMSVGPGMAAALYLIENHFGIIRPAGINLFMDPRAVIRV